MTKSNEYKLNDILVFKKTHPCGSDSWKVLRIGSDMKLECVGCKRIIMISRLDVNKRVKKIIREE